jgi:hypothetical protein
MGKREKPCRQENMYPSQRKKKRNNLTIQEQYHSKRKKGGKKSCGAGLDVYNFYMPFIGVIDALLFWQIY